MDRDLARCEWRKSKASGGNNACVEAAVTPAVTGVRDTKNRTAGHLAVSADAWATFLNTIRAH